ncbi:DUF1501 domain-containing protein [Singulisphaera sp. PoT]|uniref:DUF1501 domain-containing protein n=1 Tax=Singulisphaera sp. PoT TaxID=3411797 RepID=UPI003BF5A112
MSDHGTRPDDRLLDRRELLRRSGMGFGLLGLAGLVSGEAHGKTTDLNPLLPKSPHFAAKAKRVVHLFMNGGPSQMDTFDPKPLLNKYHGKALPNPNLRTERKTGAALGSPFKFKKHGESGIEVSEIFSRTAGCIDDICVIRSMYADVPNHEPSLLLMNCGDGRLHRPSMGSWVTYGLGSENQNLPGFVAMCPGGYPVVATQNWRSSFLPGAYQGTYIDTQHTDIRKLIENIRNDGVSNAEQRKQLDLVNRLNERHLEKHQHDPRLEARIQSFELAYRMQSEASDAFDFEKEPQAIKEMYGTGLHGRQLMITRRLLERGVRVVQVWNGAGQAWDNHENINKDIRDLATSWDQPIAAFLKDLKQRGMLEDTLVIWGGEFGRTPVAELPSLSGRDHNHYGFSMWMAGGGVKGGSVVGATDEFGFAAVENKVHVHDLHATILHLLGFDHEQLTYRYAGRDFRLTDVHGHVVKDILA